MKPFILNQSSKQQRVWQHFADALGVKKPTKKKDGFAEELAKPFTPVDLVAEMFCEISLSAIHKADFIWVVDDATFAIAAILETKPTCKIIISVHEQEYQRLYRTLKTLDAPNRNHDSSRNVFENVTIICYNTLHDLKMRLEEEIHKMGMQFDIVVGNPPFSTGNGKESNKLWAQFIEMSFAVGNTVALITPMGWVSSTNSAYKTLKHRVLKANLSSSVSNAFGGVGGSQRFSWFLAGHQPCIKTETIFDEGTFIIDLFETQFSPAKSSSIHDFNIMSKLARSGLATPNWKRVGLNEPSSGVVVPMAKTPFLRIQALQQDHYTADRYKCEFSEGLAYNLNLPLYQLVRWILRSGPALAGNFKLVPIPLEKNEEHELYQLLNLNKEEISHIRDCTCNILIRRLQKTASKDELSRLSDLSQKWWEIYDSQEHNPFPIEVSKKASEDYTSYLNFLTTKYDT